MSLVRMKVSLQDMILNLDDFTLFESDRLWTLERGPIQILDYTTRAGSLGTLGIELSQDLIHYERTGYTLLDLLSDIGGIQGLAYSFLSMTVGLFSNGIVNEYLVYQLYNLHPKDSQKSQAMSSEVTFSRPCCRGFKLSLISLFSCCCRFNRKEKALMRAFEKYEQESDFVELIRHNRFVKSALNKILTVYEISQLQRQALKETLDNHGPPDSSDKEWQPSKRNKPNIQNVTAFDRQMHVQDPSD